MSNRYRTIRQALDRAERADPPASLDDLRTVLEMTGMLLDEQLAAAVLDHEMSLRAAGKHAGLTENAVGPRLARTAALSGYARPDGRVTAKEIHIAREDRRRGIDPPAATPPAPMRFKPRRGD